MLQPTSHTFAITAPAPPAGIERVRRAAGLSSSSRPEAVTVPDALRRLTRALLAEPVYVERVLRPELTRLLGLGLIIGLIG